MNTQLKEYMHFFGYASHPTEKSPYQLTKYTDQTAEDLEMYNGYLKSNAKVLESPEVWKVNSTPSLFPKEEFIACIASQKELVEVKNP